MDSILRTTLLVFTALALASSSARAAFSVDANSMIYQAAGNLPSTALDPYEIPVTYGPNLAVVFPFIDGLTDCYAPGDICVPYGPDGNLGGVATVSEGTNRLSGVLYRGYLSLPLLGVFVGPALPASPPDGYVFVDNVGFINLFPRLGQVFWIGDGRSGTGTGETQIFHIPEGATRLFVGFYDPVPNDNTGSLTVQTATITSTDVSDRAAPPAALWFAAAPNPSRGTTQLRFALTAGGHVNVTVTDIAGRLVRTIADESLSSGEHAFAWDGRDAGGAHAPAGVYQSVLRVDGRFASRRTIVLVH